MPRGNRKGPYGFTKENAKEMSLRGAAKRKENYVKRKKMKETLDILLRLSIKKGKTYSPEEIESLAEARGLNVDAQTAILLSTIQEAMNGDVDAAKFVRDTVGEKPTDKVEVDASKTIEEYAKTHKVSI